MPPSLHLIFWFQVMKIRCILPVFRDTRSYSGTRVLVFYYDLSQYAREALLLVRPYLSRVTGSDVRGYVAGVRRRAVKKSFDGRPVLRQSSKFALSWNVASPWSIVFSGKVLQSWFTNRLRTITDTLPFRCGWPGIRRIFRPRHISKHCRVIDVKGFPEVECVR